MCFRRMALLGVLVALAWPAGAESAKVLQVLRAGQAPRLLEAEAIAKLPAVTQDVTFPSSHGEQKNSWTGPLLWDVLAAAGAVDPTKPAGQVRLVVRVTGADGYAAVLALAELSPDFAGRPIQLAERMNGAPIAGPGWRLVVPGERRAGRSVRDVIRIEVE